MTSSINNQPATSTHYGHHEVLLYMRTVFFNKYLGIYKASMDYLFLQFL